MHHEPWDFTAVYFDGIDHFWHGFMRYHPPRLPWVTEEDFAIYQHVVANAYRYHDAMLGRLLELAGHCGAQAVEIFAARQHFDYTSREHVGELAGWFRSNSGGLRAGRPRK